jgi:hypothetical protein
VRSDPPAGSWWRSRLTLRDRLPAPAECVSHRGLPHAVGAEALRTGDPEIFVPIGNLGDQPARDINTFATNNSIEACVM